MKELHHYNIDSVRGFLPADDPLQQLPSAFAPWEEACAWIPGLLICGKIRSVLDKLEEISPETLETEQERWRAYLLLSVLANAFIMGEEEQAKVLPRNIAVPLWQVTQKLGLPPLFTYSSMILNNWKRVDKSAQIGLDNLMIMHSYYGGMDEHWFLMSMAAIEAKGGPALQAIADVQSAADQHDHATIEQSLKTLATAQVGMVEVMHSVPEKCDPYVFYHRVRPILDAWKEPGVIYEGVSEEPQMWIAASAAQCSLVQAIDLALGIKHAGSGGAFLKQLWDYMPPGHRQFLVDLEAGPSLHHYLTTQGTSALIEIYNENILLLDSFRKKHLEITGRYVVQQANKAGNPIEYGTSGTHLSHFLSQVRKETTAFLIH